MAESAIWQKLAVRDNGIGIPSEMLPRVFDMFTQVDSSLNRSYGGLGIGLSLVRTLVQMHGGDCGSVNSDGVGQGSEFVVRLPVSHSMKKVDSDVIQELLTA